MNEQFLILFGVLKTTVELIVQNQEGWDKYRMRNTAQAAMKVIKDFCDKKAEVKELVEMADKYVEEMMRR